MDAPARTNKAGAILPGVLYYLTKEPFYHDRPWTWPPQVVHIGVNAMCAHWQSITPAKFQGDNLAVLAVASFHDGLGQWWTDEVISTISMGWSTSALGQGGVWGKLLWYDYELPRVEPKMLPPARLFPENGHVVMRSDWSENATHVWFRCGRYGESDGWWGRNNADSLHFIIAKRGIFAADTVPELYNLDTDVAEQAGLFGKHPDMVEWMTTGLRGLIDRGTSRDGQQAANDTPCPIRDDAAEEMGTGAA